MIFLLMLAFKLSHKVEIKTFGNTKYSLLEGFLKNAIHQTENSFIKDLVTNEHLDGGHFLGEEKFIINNN